VLEVDEARSEGTEAADLRSAASPSLLNRYGPTVIAVALLLATAAAFLLAQRLKLERSPVQRTRVTPVFSPVCDCETSAARVRFSLRRPARATVVVVRGGRLVRELAVDDELARGRHSFVWDGLTDDGATAGDGVYHVRVALGGGRTITLPNTITLDTTPPVVRTLQSAYPHVFSPDRDGHSDVVRVRYGLSEPGHARLYANGTLVVRGHSHATTAGLAWYGGARGVRFRPGRYRVVLGAVDLAGNVAKQVPAGVVRLRYVSLAQRIYRVRPRARFTVRVSTDARKLAYRLHGRIFSGRAVVRLRAPAVPGRYRLVVTAGRHRARGLVLVRR
jgi:hypothetical protein